MNQEVKVNFPEKIEFWKLTQVILDYTDWGKDYVFNKSGGAKFEEKVFARGLIYYIAINNGCTYTSCGKLTDRDHTSVLRAVSSFENRLTCEVHSRRFFQEVMAYINENYHLYHNMMISDKKYYGRKKVKGRA